jgi:hypothetical protein
MSARIVWSLPRACRAKESPLRPFAPSCERCTGTGGFVMRCLIWLATILLIVAQQPAIAAKAPSGTTLRFMPDVSIHIPPNWGACEAPNLGSFQSVFGSMEKLTCRGTGQAIAVHIQDMEPGKPLYVTILQDANGDVSDESLRLATPDFVDAISREACKRMSNAQDMTLDSCRWATTTLAGHPALTLRAVMVHNSDPLKLPYRLQAFLVPDRGGDMEISFVTPNMVAAKTQVEINNLLLGVHIEAATVAPPTPASPEMIALAPAEGISLSLPKGWIACDDATNALLGNAADPLNVKAQICSFTLPGVTFLVRAYNPVPLRSLAFTMSADPGNTMTEDAIKSTAANLTPDITKQICEGEAGVMPDTVIVSCDVSSATFAGHAAILTTIVGIPHQLELSKFKLRIYELSGAHGYAQFQFNTPTVVESATDPIMDSIASTIAVQ